MTGTGTHLSDADAASVLALIRDADSVELKLTVPARDHRSTVAALGMDPLDAQIRQVFFFDTPDLALDNPASSCARRRVQGKGDDTVVKLRPVAPDELPEELRKLPGFGVEVDAMPGGYVCSASLKGDARVERARTSRQDERPLRKLFTKEQRAFYARARSRGRRARRPVGPRADLRAQAEVHPEGVRPPARRRDVALSGRLAHPRALDEVPPARGVPGRGRDCAPFLTSRGVDLGGEQQTKTRKALLYFSERLLE